MQNEIQIRHSSKPSLKDDIATHTKHFVSHVSALFFLLKSLELIHQITSKSKKIFLLRLHIKLAD